MQAAGLGPLLVDRAATCLRIEEVAVPAGAPRHREDVVLGVVVVDQPHLHQPLGDELGLHVVHLERVHQPQPHQVGQLHLQRHGAAVGRAAVAQSGLVLAPGVEAVHVDDADGGFHGVVLEAKQRPERACEIPIFFSRNGRRSCCPCLVGRRMGVYRPVPPCSISLRPLPQQVFLNLKRFLNFMGALASVCIATW